MTETTRRQTGRTSNHPSRTTLKNPLGASAEKLRASMAAAVEKAFADKMKVVAVRPGAQIASGAALDAQIRHKILGSGFDL